MFIGVLVFNFFFNNGIIIICIEAEAVTGTRMHPKPKNPKSKVSRRMWGQFWIFGFLVFT